MPFEIYEIFEEKEYKFEYIKEEDNLYLFRILPEKGCKEPFKGRIGIDKAEFAIVFAEVDICPPNLGVFSVKLKIRAGFKKINDKYWLPYEVVTDSAARILWKKMKMVTKRTYSDFKIGAKGK